MSDRPPLLEDRAGFRPSRRFLRLGSQRTGRPRRVRRVVAGLGRRFWRGAELAVLLVATVILGQIILREVPGPLRLRYFQIRDLTVEGNRRVPTATIIDSLGLPAHASIIGVNLKELAGRIMGNPWIRTASVSRRLPASLVIRVSERTPQTVVLAGRAYLVSDDGLILKEAGPDEMFGLPRLTVKVEHPIHPGDRIDISHLELGTRLWQQFHRHALMPGVQAREIRLETDGSCTVFLDRGMPYLRVQEDDLLWQLDRLARVLQIRGISLRELEYVDLRFADKVIVKPLPKEREA